MEGGQHLGNLLASGEHEHLVARLHHGRAVAGNETIGLVGKAPIDGDDAHAHIGGHQAQGRDAMPDHRRAAACAHRHQAGPSARELAHLLGLWIFHSYAQPTEQARLTFFSPQGYPQDLAEHTHFGMVNAASPEQVRQSLETAQRNGAQLQIDFSPILLRQRPATAVHNTYQDAEGTVRAKTFPPLAINQVKDFPADAEIEIYIGIKD